MLGCTTLAGQYVMRQAKNIRFSLESGDVGSAHTKPTFDAEVRQLVGLELMQIAGYDVVHFSDNVPSHTLATSFAGNAFNGFVGMSVILAITIACPWPETVHARLRPATSRRQT